MRGGEGCWGVDVILSWFLMTMNMNQDVLGTTVGVSSSVCAVDCYEDCFVRNACNTRMN